MAVGYSPTRQIIMTLDLVQIGHSVPTLVDNLSVLVDTQRAPLLKGLIDLFKRRI
jgi:hypothetical protein